MCFRLRGHRLLVHDVPLPLLSNPLTVLAIEADNQAPAGLDGPPVGAHRLEVFETGGV